MKRLKDVSVDLETWGVGSNAAIVSIGAVAFDPITGYVPEIENPDFIEAENIFYKRVDLSTSASPGIIEPKTVEWWLQQSDEARAALVVEPRFRLEVVLSEFADWIERINSTAGAWDTEFSLWSRGPLFDERLLREAFIRAEEKFPVHFPVHFLASRCHRTEMASAIRLGWDPKSIEKNVNKHDALADAAHQAKGICSARAHEMTLLSQIGEGVE